MKTISLITILAAVAFSFATTVVGQESHLPKPGPEFQIFQPDLGVWDVEIKTWAGPGEPSVTTGKETNRMLGGFWFLTDFEGSMMGMEFKGHGMYSYDAEKKQYVGTWIDSMSPAKMEMVGQYDKENKTMTYEGTAAGPDGKPAKHVLTTKYKADGHRTLTMHVQAGDDMIKIFEMNYTKAKTASKR